MWQSTPFTLLLVLTGAALLGCSAFAWTRRPRPRAARELMVVSAAIATHAVGYALELSSATLPLKLFFFDVTMIGIAALPVTSVAFAFAYAGRPLSRRSLLLLSIVPACALLLVWTNPLHEAMLTDTVLVDAGGYLTRHSGSGWAWWIFLAYAYVCVIVVALSYLVGWLRGSVVHRRQARTLFLGVLAPFCANVVYHIRDASLIDTTPFTYAITIACWTWALTQQGLLDLAPVTHDAVLEMMTDAVLVLDPRGRILDANRAARELVGATDRVAGRTPAEVMGARFPALAEHLARGSSTPVELELDGRFFSVEARPLAAHRDTRVEGVVAVLHDVTARREIEDAREAALAAAREATRLRSELLARTSHEVRTPLHGILGSAELLAGTALDASQRRWVDAITGAGASLLDIVDGVLDLEQARAGLLHGRVEPFELVSAVRSVVDLFVGTASRRGLSLVLREHGEVPGHVAGDPRRLRQMLSNLIGNAVKFADAGTITVTLSAHARGIVLEVRDEGPGIDAATMAHLFTPFRPGDGSATRARGGSGLGLALTRDLAEALGGTLEIRSEVGTVATLALPFPRCEAAAPPAPIAGEIRRGARVLVFEDHPVNAAIAATALTEEGCEVTVVERAERGIALLDCASSDAGSDARFDLVLMDLHMPDVSGIEAARAIRARERASGRARVPIVAVSADVLGPIGSEVIEAGMDDTMPKPFTRAQLHEMLARHLALSPRPTAIATGTERIWQVFASSASHDLVELASAARSGAHDEVRRIAHGLHGASLFLEARAVAERCEVLLELERDADPMPHIEALATEVHRAIAETGTTPAGTAHGAGA